MRHDRKIKNLIDKYGIEGYGLYNLVLESITEKLCNEKPDPDLEESCEEMARFYNGDTSKINEIASFMINQGLLELSEITTRIECKKIYKYLEQSQTRSDKIRELIKSYKKDAKKLIKDVSQTVSDIYDRTEQNRTEQNRNADIEKIYELYPNYDSIGKRVIKNKEKDYPLLYELLTEYTVDEIITTIKNYLEEKETQYVKQFCGFLKDFDMHYNNKPKEIELQTKRNFIDSDEENLLDKLKRSNNEEK